MSVEELLREGEVGGFWHGSLLAILTRLTLPFYSNDSRQ